ncbi:hypothetical protein CW304_20840 [Bacillus sp. UFRGS-B20]|nr:hypothetical protein CW304_20840 [Bacillus sp. UFRGS-B20]
MDALFRRSSVLGSFSDEEDRSMPITQLGALIGGNLANPFQGMNFGPEAIEQPYNGFSNQSGVEFVTSI